MLITDFTVDDLPVRKMRDLYQYWLNIRGDKLMPSRADFNPADIVAILPHITIVNVERNPLRFKLVLVGSESVKAIGYEVTGKYLSEIPLLNKYAKERYLWVIENKKSYLFSSRLKWSEKSFLRYHMIGMPLSDNGIDVDKILFGGFYYYPTDLRTKIPK